MILKRHTIREGERVAIWDPNGRVQLVDGPRAVWLFRRTLSTLTEHRAQSHQYLAVQLMDGRCQNIPGPAAIWFDPVKHKTITVEDAIQLDSNEAIVVYDQQDSEVVRRVVHGPAVFVPTETEWLHEFRWHGASPKNPDRKIPRGLKFRKLRVIPDQMY